MLLPGDFCDLHVAILDRMDHSIATLTPCTMAQLPRATIEDVRRIEIAQQGEVQAPEGCLPAISDLRGYA